ncbi:hypothetical protein HMPREF0988_00957 [Lachnospiraceae bacterium 1_4_56FAA]|nr:hypothetical protein HMPREF0988_00957 [Lachnospiraceae bacterium 1_4_56FAA]
MIRQVIFNEQENKKCNRNDHPCFSFSFFFLLVVLPIYWIVITSFKTSGEILDLNNITFFPKDFTLENYTGLFEQFHYGVLLKNSLLVSVASALVVTVFSMLGGYSLARYKFRGKQTVVLFF